MPRLLRRLRLRGGMVLVLVSVALVGAEPSAAVITVSNPGTFTATQSGGVKLTGTLYSFPVTITCVFNDMIGSVSAAGAVSITSAFYGSCFDGLGGLVGMVARRSDLSGDLSSASPWLGQFKGSTGSYRLDGLIIKLNVTPGFGATCHYSAGVVTSLTTGSPVSTLTYALAGPLSTAEAGCGSLKLSGTYNLSRSLSISGSL